jgi:hypothetical protein
MYSNEGNGNNYGNVWVMAMAKRLTTSARVRAARAMVTTMRVTGDGEEEGGKVMATATRVVGKQRGALTKRAMATKTRLGGTGGSDDRPLHATGQ